ncbi:Hypothetical protein R9X50_00332000 [Acrodontium crateriforme]|uniref:N-acetyltransferase domain-containing protein n=1 Tax=Acrodontium crateriforme TaxID=150365 RepID=A0AAQ3M5Y2_9PEZI|nr:Hypothetical protein R9X50_00332000 [Acrodontium crateriforme]
MELKVEPLQPNELDEWTNVFWDSFEPVEVDMIVPMIYPMGLTPEVFEQLRQRTLITSGGELSLRCFVAKDVANGEIVGISQWRVETDPITSQAEFDKRLENMIAKRIGANPVDGANSLLGAAFIEAAFRCEYEETGGKPYVMLQLLATKPGYGRNGVGSLLLRYGFAKYDSLQLPTYLDAGVNGMPLYKKHGFTVTRVFPFDARNYGGRSEGKHWCMIRPPQTNATDP